MKKIKLKIIFSIVFIVSLTGLFAQGFDLPAVNFTDLINQSAVTPTGNIHLRALSTELGTGFSDYIEVMSVKNSQQYIRAFNNVNDFEMKAVIPQPSLPLNSLSFRIESDFINFVSPMTITGNEVTNPIYYIRAGVDDVNEESLNGDQIVDIYDQYYVLHSENPSEDPTSIRFMIRNVANNYPFSANYINFYLYGMALINPEQLTDIDFDDIDFENFDFSQLGNISVFVLLRANVLNLLNSGIYKIPISTFMNPENIDITGLLPIGNVHTSVNEGALMIGADFDVLAQDPDFGAWPGTLNTLLTVPVIIKISNPLNPTFSYDYGLPTVVYCNSYRVKNVTPEIPEISYSTINSNAISVNYSDSNGYYPVVAELRVNNQVFESYSQDFDFYNNANFIINTTTNNYQNARLFFSNDSLNYVEADYIPTSISDDVIALDNRLSVYPNPFSLSGNTENLSISFDKALNEKVKVSLFNVKGQKISEEVLHISKSADLQFKGMSRLSSGIYFLKVSNANISISQKILIIN